MAVCAACLVISCLVRVLQEAQLIHLLLAQLAQEVEHLLGPRLGGRVNRYKAERKLFSKKIYHVLLLVDEMDEI